MPSRSPQPQPETQPPTTPPKPPIPGFVWGTLIILVTAAIACLVLAVVLAPHWPPKAGSRGVEGGNRNPAIATDAKAHAPISFTAPQPAPGTAPDGAPADIPPITEYEYPAATPTPAPPPAPAVRATPAPLSNRAPGNLVLIIDDMGLAPAASRQAAAILPSPTAFAFLTYAPASVEIATEAKAAGHPIMVHIPMEPLPHPGIDGKPLDPGPNTLLATDTSTTLRAKLEANLKPLEGLATGANNHMGSRFTADTEGMRTVLNELNRKGLFFLDSVTVAGTATKAAAAGAHLSIPLYRRDVFLDDTPTEPAVRAQLARAVSKAQQQAPRPIYVIGHPHPATLAVLEAELPGLTSATGVQLVPIGAK